MEATTTPATILTADQNTGRQITWTVEVARPLPYGNGYTHFLLVTRPNGRGAAYSVHAEIDPGTGQVLRSTNARRI